MSTNESPGNALARVHSSTEVAALDQLDEILLTGELNVEIVDDPNEISRQIVAQLLAADSDEELENFGNATGWRELMSVPMELHGFRWLPSTFEGQGSAVFFVVSATRMDTGERVTLTTGSMNVLAQLSNMARRQTLVGAVRELVEASETRQGFKPLWLRTPDSIKQAQAAAKPAAAPAEPAAPKAKA